MGSVVRQRTLESEMQAPREKTKVILLCPEKCTRVFENVDHGLLCRQESTKPAVDRLEHRNPVCNCEHRRTAQTVDLLVADVLRFLRERFTL